MTTGSIREQGLLVQGFSGLAPLPRFSFPHTSPSKQTLLGHTCTGLFRLCLSATIRGLFSQGIY